jgi:hypothetical protein
MQQLAVAAKDRYRLHELIADLEGLIKHEVLIRQFDRTNPPWHELAHTLPPMAARWGRGVSRAGTRCRDGWCVE